MEIDNAEQSHLIRGLLQGRLKLVEDSFKLLLHHVVQNVQATTERDNETMISNIWQM